MALHRMFSISMNIRRLVSLSLLLFLNLCLIFYFNNQSRNVPAGNSSESANELMKPAPLAGTRSVGSYNNETEQFTNSTLILFSVEKQSENTTNETLTTISTTGIVDITLPVSFRFILNSVDLCSRNTAEHKLTLIMLVCSAIPNFEERRTIRSTWGSLAVSTNNSGNERLAFLLGASYDSELQNKVKLESAQYGDIIQQDFVDSYRNLTLKSLMLLRWVSDFCPKVHYVLKTDDDMYVNVPFLLKTLAKLPTKSNAMFGTLFRKAKPNRNQKAKWFVPKHQFQGDMFPDYLSGTGYVMTRDLVPKLLDASETVPFMVMEDVFITGICASQVRANRYNVKGFAYWKRQPSGCGFKDAITGHHVSISDMTKIWNELQNKNMVCPTPKSRHKFSPHRRKMVSGHLRKL